METSKTCNISQDANMFDQPLFTKESILYGVSATVAKISDSMRMPKSPSCETKKMVVKQQLLVLSFLGVFRPHFQGCFRWDFFREGNIDHTPWGCWSWFSCGSPTWEKMPRYRHDFRFIYSSNDDITMLPGKTLKKITQHSAQACHQANKPDLVICHTSHIITYHVHSHCTIEIHIKFIPQKGRVSTKNIPSMFDSLLVTSRLIRHEESSFQRHQ